MAGLFPLSVKISQRAPVCILDARLALAPGGLLLALRLAGATQLWLTRDFWRLVDSVFVLSSQQPPNSLEELHLWHTAWLAGRLQGFYWLGDARRESVLPDDAHSDLLAHFEQLDAALLQVTAAHNGCLEAVLSDCGRQSISLAAALGPQLPIILTLRDDGKSHSLPPLLSDATALGLKEVHEVTNTGHIALLSEGLHQSAGRMVLTHTQLAGPAALAVHVIAHNAVAMASAQDGIDLAEDEFEIMPTCSPWRDARVYWHGLS